MDPTGKEPGVKVQMKIPSNFSQPLLLWFRSTRNRRWKRNLMFWLWFVGNEIRTSWKLTAKKKKGALNQSLTIAIKSQSWLPEAQQAITWGRRTQGNPGWKQCLPCSHSRVHPTGAPEETSACESPGCLAELCISGTISVSPDTCIFLIHRKTLNSLTWDFWFSFDVLTLLFQKLLYILASPLHLFRKISQRYLRCCVLALKSSDYLPNKP